MCTFFLSLVLESITLFLKVPTIYFFHILLVSLRTLAHHVFGCHVQDIIQEEEKENDKNMAVNVVVENCILW